MTELNDDHQPNTAQPTPEWPEPAAGVITDSSVAAIVAGLDRVRGVPVTEHEGVYGELHDALLQALNEDAPDSRGGA